MPPAVAGAATCSHACHAPPCLFLCPGSEGVHARERYEMPLLPPVVAVGWPGRGLLLPFSPPPPPADQTLAPNAATPRSPPIVPGSSKCSALGRVSHARGHTHRASPAGSGVSSRFAGDVHSQRRAARGNILSNDLSIAPSPLFVLHTPAHNAVPAHPDATTQAIQQRSAAEQEGTIPAASTLTLHLLLFPSRQKRAGQCKQLRALQHNSRTASPAA